MVQSTLATVDAWMAALVPDRAPAFERLRALCQARLPGWVERMQWGMPGYAPAERDPVVSFNSQKNHIAFYAGPTAVARFADRLQGIDCGKGCVRYRRPSQIDFDVIAAMLDDIYARGETMC
ncbi:MAG: hypothetical protein A4S12_04985 [Proteobacteria bacterium SG_bin5]|nr:MAG: hypothetical protein A4S12_04985 [Proteobacteria bacterium SG_bin5]